MLILINGLGELLPREDSIPLRTMYRKKLAYKAMEALVIDVAEPTDSNPIPLVLLRKRDGDSFML